MKVHKVSAGLAGGRISRPAGGGNVWASLIEKMAQTMMMGRIADSDEVATR
jgi:hypothetical protein